MFRFCFLGIGALAKGKHAVRVAVQDIFQVQKFIVRVIRFLFGLVYEAVQPAKPGGRRAHLHPHCGQWAVGDDGMSLAFDILRQAQDALRW